MTVDILCRVVDNLGDIGFVYRLARSLSELPGSPSLRLIVDNLPVFAQLCPPVNPELTLQIVNGWQLARWDDPDPQTLTLFETERPRLVLECYACGRPQWFEEILFDETDTVPRFIINLEYLTCESWARDFHKLPSLTRNSLVRKSIFMSGFAEGTGGLLLDSAFLAEIDVKPGTELSNTRRRELLSVLEPLKCPVTGAAGSDLENAFWVLLFSYEHDFATVVADLSVFHGERPLLVLLAPGRSATPFLNSWMAAHCPFPIAVLPYLPQEQWDQVLTAADFTVVRGEESFSRAALAGQPFLWQCYPFAEDDGHSAGGQLPKVRAFLDCLEPLLPAADFKLYRNLTLGFNGAAEQAEIRAGDLLSVLRARSRLTAGFSVWASRIRELGNLAVNLLTYMRELV